MSTACDHDRILKIANKFVLILKLVGYSGLRKKKELEFLHIIALKIRKFLAYEKIISRYKATVKRTHKENTKLGQENTKNNAHQCLPYIGFK